MPVCYACPQVIQRAQPVDPLTRGVVLGDQQRAPAVKASARLRPAPAEADHTIVSGRSYHRMAAPLQTRPRTAPPFRPSPIY
jgi:hypothetical protein